MNYEPIYESRNVPAVGAVHRLKKMFGSGARRTLKEWTNEYGSSNVRMAIGTGVLSEIATPQSLVPARGIMKDGDYIVFKGGPEGFVLYHMSDNKLWRTTSSTIKGLTADSSHPVEGIDPEEGMMSVAISGHETIVTDIPAGELRAVEVPDEEFDVEMGPELDLTPEEESIEDLEVPGIQPETEMPPL